MPKDYLDLYEDLMCEEGTLILLPDGTYAPVYTQEIQEGPKGIYETASKGQFASVEVSQSYVGPLTGRLYEDGTIRDTGQLVRTKDLIAEMVERDLEAAPVGEIVEYARDYLHGALEKETTEDLIIRYRDAFPGVHLDPSEVYSEV